MFIIDGIKRNLDGKTEEAFLLVLVCFSLHDSDGQWFKGHLLGIGFQQDSLELQWAASLVVVCGRPGGARLPVSFTSLQSKIVIFSK